MRVTIILYIKQTYIKDIHVCPLSFRHSYHICCGNYGIISHFTTRANFTEMMFHRELSSFLLPISLKIVEKSTGTLTFSFSSFPYPPPHTHTHCGGLGVAQHLDSIIDFKVANELHKSVFPNIHKVLSTKTTQKYHNHINCFNKPGHFPAKDL